MAIVVAWLDADHTDRKRRYLVAKGLRVAVEVHQNINAAKPFDGLPDDVVHLVLPSDIQLEDQHLCRVAHDKVAHSFGRTARDDGSLAPGQDCFGQGSSEAGRRPRNEPDTLIARRPLLFHLLRGLSRLGRQKGTGRRLYETLRPARDTGIPLTGERALSGSSRLLQTDGRSPTLERVVATETGATRAVGEVRLLIADDHSVVRQGLRMFLALDPDLQIVGEASTGEEAIQLARELHPQVVLMDLLMPGMGGVAATGAIRSEMPDVEVIALTSVLEDAAVTGAIRAGAIGYLLKNTEADELRQAVKSAAAGQVHLSPEAAARLVREVQIPGSPEVLTERETAVLRLLAKGQANKQVARELGIGEQTVKTHVSNILGKLQLQSRTQAALYAVERGLVSASDLGRG